MEKYFRSLYRFIAKEFVETKLSRKIDCGVPVESPGDVNDKDTLLVVNSAYGRFELVHGSDLLYELPKGQITDEKPKRFTASFRRPKHLSMLTFDNSGGISDISPIKDKSNGRLPIGRELIYRVKSPLY